jgi:hypothetical protein
MDSNRFALPLFPGVQRFATVSVQEWMDPPQRLPASGAAGACWLEVLAPVAVPDVEMNANHGEQHGMGAVQQQAVLDCVNGKVDG